MSDSTEFVLSLVSQKDIDEFIRQDFLDSNTAKNFVVSKISGTTRGGYFLSANERLSKDAEVTDAIGFLSAHRNTTKRLVRLENGAISDATNTHEVIPWKLNAELGVVHEYTIVLPPALTSVQLQIDKLWNFCVENVDTHPLLSNHLYCDSSEQLFSDLQFLERLNDCPWGDEGNDSTFYFFALYAIRTLLQQASNRSLAAIYRNSYGVTIRESTQNAIANGSV